MSDAEPTQAVVALSDEGVDLEGEPLLHFTEASWATLTELWKAEDNEELVLHAAIIGRGPKGFQYDLRFVEPAEVGEDDPGFRRDFLWVRLDRASLDDLRGSILDHVDGWGGGFRFENPNPLWKDPLAGRVQALLDEQINPGVASHGGHVTLLDVETLEDGHAAVVKMGGGCQGCGMAAVTLREGVEKMIQDEIPEITEIRDATDHGAGANPYYK